MTPGAIYLDNAATTCPTPAVVEAMARVSVEQFGNPSSPHGFGEAAHKLLVDAREFLRGCFGAGQLVLTSGGTEADLLGVVGAARARPRGGRVLASASDHPALLATSSLLQELGYRFEELPVSEHGDPEPEALGARLGEDVAVVALMHGHNELGTLADLDALTATIRSRAPGAHIHVDLVQSFAKIPFDMAEVDVDSAAISAHKFHGPRGAGCLALSNAAKVQPLQTGGGQEAGLRGGTESLVGAVGMATAAEQCLSELADTDAHCRAVCEQLFHAVQERVPEARRLGHPDRRLPHILSLQIPGVSGHSLQQRCAARGLAFSTGSACHDEDAGSHVLTAIGLSPSAAREVARISCSGQTRPDEVSRAAAILREEIDELLRIGGGL